MTTQSKMIKILLIEDNPGDARLIQEMVSEVDGAEFDLERVDRLSTGLERLSVKDVDVILLDLGLPDSAGLDTFKKVYAHVPEVPIVMLTGLDDTETALEGVRMGTQDYLVKGRVDGNLLSRTLLYAIERKKARKALQESEGRYRSLINDVLDTSDVGIFILDAEFKVVWINHSTEKYFNLKREDVIGKDKRQLIRKRIKNIFEDPETFQQKVFATYDNNTYIENFECHVFSDEEREEYWLEHWSQPIRSGLYKGGRIEHYSDITDRKQAEEALKQSEEKLQSILNSMTDFCYIVSKDHKIEFMNKALMERFGDQTGNICYKAFFNRESPCPWSKLEDIQKGETIRLERYLPGLEGTFEIIDSPLTNKDGKISKLGIWRDISMRKHAEEALQETRDYLKNLIDHANAPIIVWDSEFRITLFNHAFERLTGYAADEVIGQEVRMLFPKGKRDESISRIASALAGEYWESVEIPILCKDGDLRIVLWNSSNMYVGYGKTLSATIAQGIDITDRVRAAEKKKELEAQLRQAQKMEALGTLAGGIAHDFNNILGAITGYTELAQFDAGDNPSLKTKLDKILQAGNRAKNLVKQILTFSRQDEHKLKPIQANLIVKEMLKFLRASLPTTIEIRQDIQGDAMIMGDPTQIHQVMMNLCTNAAHAMRDKGGLLDVSMVNVELDSNFVARHPGMKTGPYLQLTVSDTGHGIPPDMLDRIFEPFFTTKGKNESTGLGLSVVHGIVKSYGGTIYAYSEPGKGSSFKVYFPAIERRLEPEKREKKALPKGIEHILFVDDEQMLVNIGGELLESLGYKVTTRTSSTEALELFRSRPERFDIIITDHTMPNMTGVELAKELMAERFDIPIILCTGFSTRIIQKSVYEMGIRGFLMKPFLLRDLAETIRKVLDE